jgi:trimeric autotransporter adhesin
MARSSRNFRKIIVFAFFLLAGGIVKAQSKLISTIAGNGAYGYSGDGSAATAAKLNAPEAVAVDDSGKVYIADKLNNVIRRIDLAGTITTIAGNGSGLWGYSGDGGAATAALLLQPSGIAVDALKNIYVADYGNNVIRKIAASGVISTVAGTNAAGYSGDGGPAIFAKLSGPTAVAADASGNLYIADQNNNRIRKITASGIISTIAGNGTGGFSGDGGMAISAKLNVPSGVAIDAAGNMYIADQANNRIRMVTVSGIISTFAGNGTAGYTGDGGAAIAAQFNYPENVAVDDSSNVYIADGNNNVVRKVDRYGIITTAAGTSVPGYSGNGGAATAAELYNPHNVAVDTGGRLYITDGGNNRVRMVGKKRMPIVPTELNAVAVHQTGLAIFPNPNHGEFTISGPWHTAFADGQVELTLCNIAGQTIYKNTVPVENGIIHAWIKPATILAGGMYLLRISGGNETEVLRIMIEK